jgi:hypothetical protein
MLRLIYYSDNRIIPETESISEWMCALGQVYNHILSYLFKTNTLFETVFVIKIENLKTLPKQSQVN